MLLFTLYLYLLVLRGIQALPIQATVHQRDTSSSCIVLQECRTIWNIVWSCLATVFACTWVAIHPNVPSPKDHWFMRAMRRPILLILAILAPELVIVWAMRQWFVARRLLRDFKKRNSKWTETHSFFALMGGFMLEDPKKPRVLSPEELKSLSQKGDIDFPNITEDEIKDRSKGDGLSKAIALLQTSWFIAQCIARGAQRLSVTELEVVTVAFAVLNIGTYGFWWNKPLHVKCPVHIPLKVHRRRGEGDKSQDDPASSKGKAAEADLDDEVMGESVPVDGLLQPEKRLGELIGSPIPAADEVVHSGPGDQPNLETGAQLGRNIKGGRQAARGGEWEKMRKWIEIQQNAWKSISQTLVGLLAVAGGVLVFGVGGIIVVTVIVVPPSKHALIIALKVCGVALGIGVIFFLMPIVMIGVASMALATGVEEHNMSDTFYSGRLETAESVKTAVSAAVIALVFGAIHFIAWNFEFSHHVEQLMWRSSCIVLVAAPGLYLLTMVFAFFGKSDGALMHLFGFITFIPAILYVLARALVLALAFVSLRNLPPTAYRIVSWTAFIPQLN